MFCPKCGSQMSNNGSCPNCGYQAVASGAPQMQSDAQQQYQQQAWAQQPQQGYGQPIIGKKGKFDFKKLLSQGAWFAPAGVGATFLLTLISDLIATAINRNSSSSGAFVFSIIFQHFGLLLSIGLCFLLYFLTMSGVQKKIKIGIMFSALMPFVLERAGEFFSSFMYSFAFNGLHTSYGGATAIKYVFWVLLALGAAAGSFFLYGLILNQFSDDDLKKTPKTPKVPQQPDWSAQQMPPAWNPQQMPPQGNQWNGQQ